MVRMPERNLKIVQSCQQQHLNILNKLRVWILFIYVRALISYGLLISSSILEMLLSCFLWRNVFYGAMFSMAQCFLWRNVFYGAMFSMAQCFPVISNYLIYKFPPIFCFSLFVGLVVVSLFERVHFFRVGFVIFWLVLDLVLILLSLLGCLD